MIDKSLSQYQQNLLKGTTLGALKKSGIVDAPIQNYPTPKITVQAPKVPNISLPESQAIMSAAKIKAAPPITNLLGQNQEGAGLGSFDSKRYNALAKSFFDQTTKQAMDDPNLKYVSKFLNRPYGPTTVKPTTVKPTTVDQAGTADDAVAWPQDQGVEVGENWFQGFNDNEMQSAFSSGDQDTQNLITNLVDNGTSIFNNNPFLITALKTGTQWQAQKAVGGALAKELGFAGVGAAVGLPGMALGWLVGKAFDFFTGKGKDADKLPENVFGLPFNNIDGKEDKKVTTLSGEKVDLGSDEYVEDMKARDKEFEETGDYDVYSDTGTSAPTYSPPDPSTYTYEGSDEQDRDNENTYGGVDAGTADVQDYADIYEPPTPVYTPPEPTRDSGGDRDSGGGSRGGAPSHSTRDLMALGGRMDKR